MMDIREKKLVKTRKEHKCHLCGEVIVKNAQVVNVKGKEDERYINLYLHVPCNMKARQLDLFDEGIQHSTALKDFSIAPETDYPF